MKSETLLYFVKFPEAGKVKTRLARTVGPEEAAVAYRMLAEANLAILKPLMEKEIEIVVAFDPPDREFEMKRWLSGEFSFLPQMGKSLGERLQNAFHDAFGNVIARQQNARRIQPPSLRGVCRRRTTKQSQRLLPPHCRRTSRQRFGTLSRNDGCQKVIALGSDTLGLSVEPIREAFESLERADVVLGPAKDGGYYLIGLRKLVPELFQDIPWSTSDVFRITLSKVKARRLSYHLMPELEDLDEVEQQGTQGGHRYETLKS